jgi:hypothetical protein
MTRSKTTSASPAEINLDDWIMLSAKKLRHRSIGEAERSQWLITLQNIHTHEQYQFNAEAEHKEYGETLRNKAYLPSSSAAVKTVTPTETGAPTCILKSFLARTTRVQREQLMDRRRQGKLTSVDYLQIFGCPAVALERKKPTKDGTSKPQNNLSIMMARLGGQDLFEAIDLRQDNNAPAWMRKTSYDDQEVAFCRLLAYVAFFHQQENRPILDLKPENIIPIIKNGGSRTSNSLT